MSDRIGQLTARLQAHGIDFRSAGGGRTVGALEPLDVAAAFGFIKGQANQAIASYYYSVGNDRHGAVDVLDLILVRELYRQQRALCDLLYKHCGGADEYAERKALAMAARSWPTSAQKNEREISLDRRLRDIAGIVIDEKSGRIKTDACISECLGVDKSNMSRGWMQVVSFARSEAANALADAERDILEALQ